MVKQALVTCELCGRETTPNGLAQHLLYCRPKHGMPPPESIDEVIPRGTSSPADEGPPGDDGDLSGALSGADAMAQELAMKRHALEMARLDVQLRQLNDAQASRPAAPGAELTPLIAAIQRQTDLMLQMMQQLNKPAPAAPALDLAAIMRTVADTLKPARSGLGGLEDLKTLLDVVRPMLPTPAAGLGGIEGIREIIALGRELAGGGGQEESVAGVIKAGLETLGRPLADAYLESKQNAPPAMPGPPAAIARPPAMPPVPTLQEVQESPMNEEARIKMFLAMLLGGASRNEPVEIWVDQVLHHVPDEALDVILADPIATLERIDRRVTLHADWFRRLAAAITEATHEDPASDDTGGAERDPSNA